MRKFLDGDLATYAAALAYHVLFSLFPFVIFLAALLGFLRIPSFFDWLLDQARLALPPEAAQQVQQVVREVRGSRQGGACSLSGFPPPSGPPPQGCGRA